MPTSRKQRTIEVFSRFFQPDNPDAMLVLAHLADRSGFLDGGFVADPHLRDFNAGKRYLFCEILAAAGFRDSLKLVPKLDKALTTLNDLTPPETNDRSPMPTP